jgi:hypothetical protein
LQIFKAVVKTDWNKCKVGNGVWECERCFIIAAQMCLEGQNLHGRHACWTQEMQEPGDFKGCQALPLN